MKITNRGVVAITSPGNVISSQSTTTSPTHFHFSLSLSSIFSSRLVELISPMQDKLLDRWITNCKLKLSWDSRRVKLTQAFIDDSVFLFFFFFKTNTIPKIPSSFLLINENRKQNPKPKTQNPPQSSHLHYTYFCTFSEFIHSQVRFLLILAT